MQQLDPGYAVEVDRIDKPSWHDLLLEFDDATFYQTWSYGEKSWGGKNMSHLLLRKEGRIVAIAQLRVLSYPFLRTGAAYLNWGPLWRLRNEPAEASHLRNILRALRNEFVHGRNLALRILPKIYEYQENANIKGIFAEEGYLYSPDHLRTFVVDLKPSLEELRQNLPRTWRQSLRSAEKQNLRLWEPVQPEHFELISKINSQMKKRKSYIGSDSQQLLSINADLPPRLRLRIVLCDHEDETIAALGWSNIGKTSFPLVGGTGNKALQFKASFLLWWEMLRVCQGSGFAYCDTAGVNKKRNPGGYDFKKSIAGRNAQETGYIGQFDAYESFLSYVLFKTAMSVREGLRNGARSMKARFRRKGKR